MRRRFTSTRKSFFLYHSETTLGWRVIRMVEFARGDREVARGNWRPVDDPVTGQQIGFQVLSASTARGDHDVPSMHTAAAITAREMVMNCERSRTFGLSEDQRAELRFPEDRIERVQMKIRAWGEGRLVAAQA